jgi:hypothetical protein
VPGIAMRGLGRLCDALNSIRDTPIDAPITYEAMVYATNWIKMDDSKAMADLDLTFRPVEESMSAAIRWLLAAGHITEQQAGRLAH